MLNFKFLHLLIFEHLLIPGPNFSGTHDQSKWIQHKPSILSDITNSAQCSKVSTKLLGVICQICKTVLKKITHVYFVWALERQLSKLSTDRNGMSSRCNLYFDWLKLWKPEFQCSQKFLQFRSQTNHYIAWKQDLEKSNWGMVYCLDEQINK